MNRHSLPRHSVFYGLHIKNVITSYSIHYTKLYELDSRGAGIGLGLNIVARVCELHKARLEIVNRSPESGLCVRVTFPRLAVITSYSIHYTKLYDAGRVSSGTLSNALSISTQDKR